MENLLKKSFSTSENLRNVFVNLNDINAAIQLDIRYATPDNFLKVAVYKNPACYLHKVAALALDKVQKEVQLLGLCLKVFDGYRPLFVQQIMWDAVQDERFVSNPATNKGRHTRGTAVDLTLVTPDGKELEMPTEFDDFTEKAASDCEAISETAKKNRLLLKTVMEKQGFDQLPSEWWHFDFKGWHDDVKYPASNWSWF